ncbi:MAG: hypothetical protein PHU85_15690, partial [Phycisphaerae bacterium]|nr:hypothetical protein [Phycisphaerae bacterium]
SYLAERAGVMENRDRSEGVRAGARSALETFIKKFPQAKRIIPYATGDVRDLSDILTPHGPDFVGEASPASRTEMVPFATPGKTDEDLRRDITDEGLKKAEDRRKAKLRGGSTQNGGGGPAIHIHGGTTNINANGYDAAARPREAVGQ